MKKTCARAPSRIDPAGGGTDAPPYCTDYGGAVVNFSVARYSQASFEPLPRSRGVSIYSHDLNMGVHASSAKALEFDGRLDFLKAFVKRLLPEDQGGLLITRSDIPMRTGLGGSGAMGVAMVGALTRARGETLTKSEVALLANDIERTDLGHSGGSQDSFGSAVGGIKLVTYNKGGGCSCERLRVPAGTRAQLQQDTLLIHTGEVHLSGTIHSDIKRSYEQENSPTIRAMDNLKAAAQSMARALEAADVDTYIECLNAARMNHYALHPSCDSETLRKFFNALAPMIRGGKTCGAGGGGFIFVHMKPNGREECVRIAEALGGMVWEFKLDEEGLMVWEEAGSSGRELEEILGKAGGR